VSAAIIIGFLWAIAFSLRVSSGEYALTKNFKRVTLGSDEAQVISLLGNPTRKDEFHLGQRKGFEKAYQRASESNAKTYLFWYRGTDVVYTVGFDEQRKVVVAEYGGT
jgi:hypothetical protein